MGGRLGVRSAMTTLLAALVLTVAPDDRLPQNRIWRMVPASGSYVSGIQAAGPYTLDGFQFTVAPRADGSLPMMESLSAAHSDSGTLHAVGLVFKRGNDNVWRVYSGRELPASIDASRPTARVLLSPGTYIVNVPVNPADANRYRFAPLLTGRWLSLAEQTEHWQLHFGVGSWTTAPTLIGGGSVTGMKFSVTARPDGALPVIEYVTPTPLVKGDLNDWRYASGPLFRRVTTTAYANYDSLKGTTGRNESRLGHRCLLVPGDYILQGQLPTGASASSYRDAVLLTGYWAPER